MTRAKSIRRPTQNKLSFGISICRQGEIFSRYCSVPAHLPYRYQVPHSVRNYPIHRKLLRGIPSSPRIKSMNVSACLNIFRLIQNPSLCLPQASIPNFNHLPIPLSTAFVSRDGGKVDIRAVVLDKDNCFAKPKENIVYKPYEVCCLILLLALSFLVSIFPWRNPAGLSIGTCLFFIFQIMTYCQLYSYAG